MEWVSVGPDTVNCQPPRYLHDSLRVCARPHFTDRRSWQPGSIPVPGSIACAAVLWNTLIIIPDALTVTNWRSTILIIDN
jgi:hypothetical protein